MRPEVFGAHDAAVAFLKSEMLVHWEAQKEFNPDLPAFPEDWQAAQSVLAELHTDGSWGWYSLTVHDLPKERVTSPNLSLFEMA